jgi:predicted ArsR family transcriptional regulator
MPAVNLSTRFLQTTRGRIVSLLRRGARTVEEIASAVGLTGNAIRVHLATLERDGLVRSEGVRRGLGAGKPAALYEITPDAEAFFSRAYAPALGALLDELAEKVPAEQRAALMSGVGRRLAAKAGRPPAGDLDTRVEAAAALLTSLGGAAAVERRDGVLEICGCAGCPLSAATAHGADLCQAVETLLSDFIGAPVAECCERGERPRCRFSTPAAA